MCLFERAITGRRRGKCWGTTLPFLLTCDGVRGTAVDGRLTSPRGAWGGGADMCCDDRPYEGSWQRFKPAGGPAVLFYCRPRVERGLMRAIISRRVSEFSRVHFQRCEGCLPVVVLVVCPIAPGSCAPAIMLCYCYYLVPMVRRNSSSASPAAVRSSAVGAIFALPQFASSAPLICSRLQPGVKVALLGRPVCVDYDPVQNRTG